MGDEARIEERDGDWLAPAEPGAPPGLRRDDEREHDHDEMPRLRITARRALVLGLFVATVLALLYFVVPELAGLRDTWDRLGEGETWWLVVAFAFEVLSFLGHIFLFRAVFARDGNRRITLGASYEITMAGFAATRIFAAGGAGGIALTAWAARRAGMPRRVVAVRIIAFTGVLYIVYVVVLLLCGIGLRVGILPGGGPFGVTVIPAVFGGVMIAIGALIVLMPRDLERRIDARAHGHGRVARLLARGATGPASASAGLRLGLRMLRERDVGLLGSLMWWGFDIATLWACFRAFGHPPTVSVTIMAYFVGMLGNLLPLPGGVGGVDGGMIGAFLAFGVGGGLAVVAVLVYRAFSFWLPIPPGVVAYFQLRRRVARWREQPTVAA